MGSRKGAIVKVPGKQHLEAMSEFRYQLRQFLRLLFWLGAIATGFVAVFYAKLMEFGYDTFLRYASRYWWLPFSCHPGNRRSSCVADQMLLSPLQR
jgi:hypothetical protein